MSRSEIARFKNEEAVALAGARRFLGAALEAVREHGRFVVVLSGGSTPRVLYRLLASGPLRPMLPWSRTVILFGDERCVGPDHEQSNYRMALETLLDQVRIPARQIHRMRGELDDPTVAAAEYEATLRGLYPNVGAPPFDLLLLGMGDDGHTASLFPETAALDETDRWVVANDVPRLGSRRITLTLPALRAARRIVFLITGEAKARVLAEAFGGAPHDSVHPCERVVPVDGTREILVDEAAAKLL